jgi:hypothetical protein
LQQIYSLSLNLNHNIQKWSRKSPAATQFWVPQSVFCLGYVSDRASFTITKIEAYKKNFEQKIGVLWLYNAAKRDLQFWRSGEPQTLFINTSSFCYFHTKSTQNIQELLLLDKYSQIWRNEAATLWTKAYLRLVLKYLEAYFYNYMN